MSIIKEIGLRKVASKGQMLKSILHNAQRSAIKGIVPGAVTGAVTAEEGERWQGAGKGALAGALGGGLLGGVASIADKPYDLRALAQRLANTKGEYANRFQRIGARMDRMNRPTNWGTLLGSVAAGRAATYDWDGEDDDSASGKLKKKLFW